jgi:hypothetical protein
MVDISDAQITTTVSFGRPVTGNELMQAVQATAGDGYFAERSDGGSYLVGQTSGYPYQCLLVTPNETDALVDPGKSYDSAAVIRHDAAERRSTYLVGYSTDREIDTVRRFAEQLRQHLGGNERAGGVDASRDPYAPAWGAVSEKLGGPAQAGSTGHHTTGKQPGARETWADGGRW